jgi:hypothetical protein
MLQKRAGIWGNFGLCWCGWRTVGSAADENRFTVSRTSEKGVLWCRFRAGRTPRRCSIAAEALTRSVPVSKF